MTTYRDIKLGTDGDLDMTKQDLQLVGDMDAVLQAVKIRLQFFREEWFADESIGVPYFQQILVKNPNVNVLTTLFRNVITDTPGIRAVTSLQLNYAASTRKLAVTFSATTDFGELENATLETAP